MPRMPDATLRERAAALGLHGLLARWHAVETESWLLPLITAEETERCPRASSGVLRRTGLEARERLQAFFAA